jgi:hypothetical protein
LRRDEAAQIEQISRETLPLLEEIGENLDDQPRVNRAIAKIDKLRARMDQYGQTYDHVTQFTQQTELARFSSDRKLAAARLDGAERQRKQVERDIDNVRAIIAAAQVFQQLMTEVAGQLARASERQEAA